ncbi:MAG: tRNA (adenosine(37)-N6)-dimethylallyltransferase MiaA [Prevotellaceae bacterium]|jgi:tRNA dimethylallyltransferase|nr:tRNA (adenosine(37)-N6)-dimethylallyltransferase MiaA [Prevotellaceae bacterium]
MTYNLLVLLGPTAVGKTEVAVQTAARLRGEVLSGDSRQVYRGMDIGTGKDLEDYTVNGVTIPCHLIDIAEAGEKYNVYQYQKDFFAAYNDICRRGKTPVLCGGSGMYIEAVTRGYNLPDVPADPRLRSRLEQKSSEELITLLKSLKTLHNTTDIDTRQRTIRAIEVAIYQKEHPSPQEPFPAIHALFVGLWLPREQRRERITQRLHSRLQNGLVEEVERLLQQGIPAADLVYYGLEYKFVTLYLLHKTGYDEMVERLNIAIHQFAKRQMTWFRGMERKGIPIHWLDASLPMEEKIDAILQLYQVGKFNF